MITTEKGRFVSKRLTCEGLAHVLAKRAGSTKVEHFSSHDLRRSFANHLLDKGPDLPVVQKFGHRQISTTQSMISEARRKLKAARLVRKPIGC